MGDPEKEVDHDRYSASIREAASDIKEPVKLVQPKIVYLYADPDLEERSIGQRTLMRIGSDNEAKVKTKLQEIRQELLLHMHAEEVQPAE